MEEKYRAQLRERFCRYAAVDTESSSESKSFPSTEKQKDLGQLLARELQEMGLRDARRAEWGYVFATLPATTARPLPVLGLIAHLDTSPDVSGTDVKPQIHEGYRGGDIQLPGDQSQVIRFAENPALARQIGHDIITSDGRTLLGADNKAGIAEIITALQYLLDHPEIEHGKVRVAFTPDEETGRGTEHFDPKEFGADYAYTIDGETLGEVENETFCADTIVLTVKGVNVHPGFAKDRLVNAIKIASELVAGLPPDRLSPETTEQREGYLHPHAVTGNVEKATVKFLVRDFTPEGLHTHEAFLKELAEEVVARHPRAALEFRVEESYRNMRYRLDETPHVVENALEAVRRSGVEPRLGFVRGGTDGARLCYMGLPTPNIFTGGHNFHSKLEWVSVQDMEKTVETIVNLVRIWVERAGRDPISSL